MRLRDDLVFPMAEFERRLTDLRARMDEHDLDVMLTTTPENICYLSGFDSPGHWFFNALLVPREGEPVAVPRLLEDSGYEALTWLEVRRPYSDSENPMERLNATLQEFGWSDKRIGYEKNCWFFTALQQEQLFALRPNATFLDCSGIVEAGRVIKSEYEIELMRKAARAAEAGMRAGIDAVQAGATDHDVAAEMSHAMIKAGSEWPSIAPFVAVGERGAIGHATWYGSRIKQGDYVMLEIGGCLKRYHAAMMRTGFVGEPDADSRVAEQAVLAAFDAQAAAIRPGVPAEEVHAASAGVLEGVANTLGVKQGSRSGYSIGIGLPPDWGEGQILSIQPGETRVLQPNMTFHLLPWVQVPGKAGISFSETIRVTENGCETLTNFERKLFVK